jgi:mgtE-like transporter
LSSSLWLGVLAKLAAAASGAPSITVWNLITVSVVGGFLGSVFILAVTVGLSVLSHRRGWDLDSVSTPMVTALGDMVTLPTLFLATSLLHVHAITVLVGVVCAAAGVYATVASYLSSDRVVRRIVIEMTAVILLTPLLDIISGALQESRLPQLGWVLLTLIPPFVSQAGALGGIFASRISSKLQIGVITPSGFPETPALVDASVVFTLGVVVFALIGGIAVGLADLTGHAPALAGRIVLGTIVAGLLAMPITIATGYYLAIASYRFGLDPDNQTVPIITSVMDLAGVACVLFVMTVSGVLPHG